MDDLQDFDGSDDADEFDESDGDHPEEAEKTGEESDIDDTVPVNRDATRLWSKSSLLDNVVVHPITTLPSTANLGRQTTRQFAERNTAVIPATVATSGQASSRSSGPSQYSFAPLEDVDVENYTEDELFTEEGVSYHTQRASQFQTFSRAAEFEEPREAPYYVPFPDSEQPQHFPSNASRMQDRTLGRVRTFHGSTSLSREGGSYDARRSPYPVPSRSSLMRSPSFSDQPMLSRPRLMRSPSFTDQS
ncbi:hypothetical protein BGZ70_004573, partial [Mortierella alpina]